MSNDRGEIVGYELPYVGFVERSVGTFWGAEGVGATWPGGDIALVALLGLYAGVAFALVAWLRHQHAVRLLSEPA